jgi:hypothetical protein
MFLARSPAPVIEREKDDTTAELPSRSHEFPD